MTGFGKNIVKNTVFTLQPCEIKQRPGYDLQLREASFPKFHCP